MVDVDAGVRRIVTALRVAAWHAIAIGEIAREGRALLAAERALAGTKLRVAGVVIVVAGSDERKAEHEAE